MAFAHATSLAGLLGQVRAQASRWTLWSPVAFGFGAAAYLNLRFEPDAGLTLAVALGLIAAVLIARSRLAAPVFVIPLVLLAFGVAGFAAGKLRSDAVAAPISPDFDSPVMVEGWVVDVASPGAGGGRLLIAPVRVEGLAPEETPKRVRITVGPDALIGPGAAIRVFALVSPPPPPASPGAYDFARDAWFDGIGGVGFALKPPVMIKQAKPPWRLRARMAINSARWSLSRRIVERIGEGPGALAAAMTTGHEAWITPKQADDMRASGLAHILSISGLHMAIVGGFAFAFARLLVAAWPWLALRINGKKAAAVFGLMAVGGYLVISGAPPPAERAAITAAVAFCAILADRRAISLHALAVAALIILAVHPEAACEPGFQMSFAATTALVALAEMWRRPAREIQVPWPIRFVQTAGVWIALAVGVSLVAGMATGPFAMQHFNRVASYGLLANLLVAPLSSFVIMPMLALGAVLEPLGLGGPFLHASAWGIERMTDIAAWTSGLPGATVTVASAPPPALPTAFMGILIVCLWRGWLRWLGLPLACAVMLWPRPEAADIWIDSEGAAAAVRDGQTAVLMRPEARRFAADFWAKRRGLTVPEDAEAVRDTMFDCNRRRCLPLEGSPISAWWWNKTPDAEQAQPLCEGAEVAIFRSVAPEDCAAGLVLERADFARGGSAELYHTDDSWRIVWANDLRGERPWVGTPLP